MKFLSRRVAPALWLCCCLATLSAGQRRFGGRDKPGARPIARSRLSFRELFASRFTTPRVQRNLTGFAPFNPRVTPGTCPLGCRCYGEREVHCSFKRLKRVPANLPPNAVKINLAFNKISIITPGAFAASNASLKVLVLQSNEIAALRGGELNDLRRLGILRLSSNRLTGVYRRSFQNMSDLARLHLDQNAIGFVHPQAFRGLARLTFLQLEGNRLSRLHSDTFATVQFMSYFTFSHVQYLYLSNNRFTLLPQALLAGLTSLRKIYLHGNPWDCSCQIQWLHQWMRESGKYRCKMSLFGANNASSCALCASPSNLRGLEVIRVPFDNVTCFSPRPKTPHEGAISEKFQDETSWLELQNEAVLFRQGARAKESMTLRLDSRIGSLLLMHCEAARKPETSTGLQRGGTAENDDGSASSYVGTFEAIMTCMVDYPAKTQRLDDLLKPYLNAALNFTVRSVGARQRAGRRRDYDVKIIGEPFEPLAPLGSGLRIATASVLESSPVLESGQFIVTIASNRFYPEDHKLALLFQSKQVFRPTPEQQWKGDPWTTVMRPRPDARDTVVGLVRLSVVLTCRAMGVPRPKLSWILPDKTVLAASRRYKRFRVSRGGRLIIRKLSKQDAGVYYCMSTSSCDDKVAEDAASVRLHVFSSSEVGGRSEVRSARAQEGEDVRIDCAVEASPAATIVWSTPTRSLLNSNSSEGARILADGSLSLEMVEISQSGFYSCVAANRMGALLMTTFLEVTKNHEIVESEIGDDMFEWDEYDNMDIEYVVNPALDEDTTTWLPPSTTWFPPSTTWLPPSTTKIPFSTTKTPTMTRKIPFSTTKTPTMTRKIPFSTTKTPTMTRKIPFSTTKTPTITMKIPFSTTKTPTITTKIPFTTTKTPTMITKIPVSSTEQQPSNTQHFPFEKVKATDAVVTTEPFVPNGPQFTSTEIDAVAAASTTRTTSAAPETASHQKERASFYRPITGAGLGGSAEQRSNGFGQTTLKDVPSVSLAPITTTTSAKTTLGATTQTSLPPFKGVLSTKVTETVTVISPTRASTLPLSKPRSTTRFLTTDSDVNDQLSNLLPAGLKAEELPRNNYKKLDVENAVEEIETILKPTIRNLTGDFVDIGTANTSHQATTERSSPQFTTTTFLSPTNAKATTTVLSTISTPKPGSMFKLITTNSNGVNGHSDVLQEGLGLEESNPNKEKAFDVEKAVEKLEVIFEPRLRILNGDSVDIGTNEMFTKTSVPLAAKLSPPTTTSQANIGSTTSQTLASDFLVTSKPKSTTEFLTTSSSKVLEPSSILPESLKINVLSPNNEKAFDVEKSVERGEVVFEPKIHNVANYLVDIDTDKSSTQGTTTASLQPVMETTKAQPVVSTTLASIKAASEAGTTTLLSTTAIPAISDLSRLLTAGLKIKEPLPNKGKAFDVEKAVEEVKFIAEPRPAHVTNGLLDVGNGKSLNHINKQSQATTNDIVSTQALATSTDQTEMEPVPDTSHSPQQSQTSGKPDRQDTLFGGKSITDKATSGQSIRQTSQAFRFTPTPGISLSPLTFASQASIGTLSASQLSDSKPLPVSTPAVIRDGQEPTRALLKGENSVPVSQRTRFTSAPSITPDDVITTESLFEVPQTDKASVIYTSRAEKPNGNDLTSFFVNDQVTTATQSGHSELGNPEFDGSDIVVFPSLSSLTKPSRNVTKIVREAPRTVSTQLHQSELQEFSYSVEGVEKNFVTLLCKRETPPSDDLRPSKADTRGSTVLKSTWTLPSGERVSFPDQLSERFVVGLNSLIILELKLNDSGTYFCDSSSETGLSRAVITLAVRPKSVSTEASGSTVLPIEDPPKFDVDSQFVEPGEGRTLAANSPAAVWRTVKPKDTETGKVLTGKVEFNNRNAIEETSTLSTRRNTQATTKDTKPSNDKEARPESRSDKVFRSVEVVRASYGDALDIKCSLSGVDAEALTWKFIASDVTDAINHFDVTSLGKIGDDRSVFSITKLSLMHNGTFTCSANDTRGRHIHDTQLMVLSSAPSFTQPSQKSLTIERGQSVTIPCEAKGAPKPEVGWSWPRTVAVSKRYTTADSSRPGKVYTSPDNVLHIENAVPQFGVMFLCTARNAVGRAMHEVYVTISPAHRAPQLTTDLPESYDIESGQELTLDCSATGHPLPRISWKLPNNQRLHANQTNNGYVMMENGALKLPSVTLEMAGRYQCIAENTEGIVHKSLELTVHAAISEAELETTGPSSSPTIAKTSTRFQVTKASSITNSLSRDVPRKTITRQTDVPISLYSYKTASYYGDTVELQCTRPPRNRQRTRQRWMPPQPVITRWELPSGEVASFPAQVPSWRHRPLYDGVLRIREVTSNDSGVYRCVRRDKFKGNILSRTEATLSVRMQPPVLRQALRQRVVAYKGRMAKADCSVSRGNPKPRVYWVAPNGRIYTAGSYGNGLYVKYDGQLVIRSLDLSFLGTYQCIAENLAGNLTRLVAFQTKPFVPKIRRSRYTRTVYVRHGRTARLECTAVGVPTPDVYWILPRGQRVVESRMLINGDGSSGDGAVGGNGKYTLLASGTLQVSHAKSSDDGRYICRAANVMGVASKTVRLRVYR